MTETSFAAQVVMPFLQQYQQKVPHATGLHGYVGAFAHMHSHPSYARIEVMT